MRGALREVAPVTQETQEARPLDANAEAPGKKKPNQAVEAEDGVELDDEGLDDALIEASDEEDTDVTEIIGGDIENEEET